MLSLIRRHAATAACAVACAWAILLLAAPWLAAAGGPGLRLTALAYLSGSIVCHQRPARSFHAAGAQLPVCARCTGLYVAGACALLFGLALSRFGMREPAAILAGRWTWRAVLVASALPMLATVGLEWGGVWAVSNGWRAATAAPAAWVVGALTLEFLSFRGRL